jgi:hypothetical protein
MDNIIENVVRHNDSQYYYKNRVLITFDKETNEILISDAFEGHSIIDKETLQYILTKIK